MRRLQAHELMKMILEALNEAYGEEDNLRLYVALRVDGTVTTSVGGSTETTPEEMFEFAEEAVASLRDMQRVYGMKKGKPN